MIRHLLQNRSIGIAISAAVGLLFFLLMFGADLLQPTHIQWLLRNEDSRMQFIGWHSYRLEPWQMPPGKSWRYGMTMGSSIVFTDAVPLLAIFFKPFDPLLPDRFQYMGGWLLACYMLQAIIAWLLSGLITARPAQRLIIVAFFVISPIMLHRVIAHHALVAHWLLLAALYGYARPVTRRSNLWWCVLLATAALVNAYLLYMVLAVWLAYVIRRTCLDRDWPRARAARDSAAAGLALIGTMWMAGYFTLPVEDFSGGRDQYGRYAFNLNGLWNPLWVPTLFFSPRPVAPGTDIEASNYAGAGVIALVPLAIIAAIRGRTHGAAWRRSIPLIAAAAVLFIVAVSHQIRFDDRLLLSISLPDRLLDTLATVRSSARLSWVAYYGTMLAILALIATGFRTGLATALLVAGLAVQLLDGVPRYLALKAAYHEYFHNEGDDRMMQLSSSFWETAAKHYRTIRFVPVAHKPPAYDALALFAAEHGMAINVGYFGRVSNGRIAEANRELEQELSQGRLRDDSLYVFWDGNGPPSGLVKWTDGSGTIDGYRIIAPRWFEFDDCCATILPFTLSP